MRLLPTAEVDRGVRRCVGARPRALPNRNATRSFAEDVAWLAPLGLFGLLLSPGENALGIRLTQTRPRSNTHRAVMRYRTTEARFNEILV
jgi:hypothetical protein